MLKLIRIVHDSDITELLVQQGRAKIHIRRGALAAGPYPEAAANEGDGFSSAEETSPADGLLVLSPMVGRFYRSSSPDARPFVEVGEMVTKGQKLCIIEAMKVLNEVHAEFDGKIAEVLAENGQAVEYGQPLFRLVPLDHIDDRIDEVGV